MSQRSTGPVFTGSPSGPRITMPGTSSSAISPAEARARPVITGSPSSMQTASIHGNALISISAVGLRTAYPPSATMRSGDRAFSALPRAIDAKV